LSSSGLTAGVDGKRALWLALGEVREHDQRLQGFDFEALAERARAQHEKLERHRLAAAVAALAS